MPLTADDLAPALDALALRPPGGAILGVRPEDFALARDSTEGRLTLDLVVDAIERVGRRPSSTARAA